MKIPKYWARGTYNTQDRNGQPAAFSCWHWSDHSLADAQGKAVQRAQRMATSFLAGQRPNRYAYGVNPLREEVVGVVSSGTREVGLLTRNRYGAVVLNAAQAMFIDIDFEGQPKSSSLLGSLFGVKAGAPESALLPSIEQWTRRFSGLGVRVYRTAAGLRCLVTSDTFDPTQPGTLDMMRSLNSDPLYVTLCRQQESFRARLTPKPWRCAAPQPPSQFPFETPSAEARYRQWEREYQSATSNFAVCRLIASYGSERVHPDITPILNLHDQYCRVQNSLELA
jgi:hypothetical protein